MTRRERFDEAYRRLRTRYPKAKCSLDYTTPFELLVATILSAQSTDARVNLVTPELFRKYPSPEALADAKLTELEKNIHSTGFYRNKAKSLLGAATAIVEHHGGVVPDSLEELVRLPGVGRKTANVVLGNAFGKNEGIVVDTHVGRVARRLGFAKDDDAAKVEQDLMNLAPRRLWTKLSHLLILHGREVCEARKPQCESCDLADLCPSARI